ncbi:MAG: hypothetical protein M0P33_06485 [Massilibacteroides sp.]|nr:hypothetical protein [Massilibacteroides sp.]
MILTNLFLRKKIKKLAKASYQYPHAFKPLEKVNTIVLLYLREQMNSVEKISRDLIDQKIAVKHVIYDPNESLPDESASHLYVGNKDLNTFGFPSAYVKKKFQAMKADLIIDLTVEPSYFLRYLALCSPDAFRVGIGRAEELGYEFTLRSTEKSDLAYNFSQILFYLRSFDAK